MPLRDYCGVYLLSRDLCPDYAASVRRYVANLDVWLGTPADLDLTAETLNNWLVFVTASGLRPRTVRAYRQAILALLHAAESEGLRGPLGRVRRPKVPRRPVVGWNLDQVRRLIGACQATPGYCVRTGLPLNLLLESTVRICWDSGARIGDVLDFRWTDLSDGGRLVWSQSKTGLPCQCHLSAGTMDALQRLHAGRSLELLLPWRSHDVCHRAIAVAVKAAGLTGATRMLRRGSASYVERLQPGTAWRHLGHAAPGLDKEFYIDAAIAYSETVRPPEL